MRRTKTDTHAHVHKHTQTHGAATGLFWWPSGDFRAKSNKSEQGPQTASDTQKVCVGCVCVCVCVCVRNLLADRVGTGDCAGLCGGVSMYVCVCVWRTAMCTPHVLDDGVCVCHGGRRCWVREDSFGEGGGGRDPAFGSRRASGGRGPMLRATRDGRLTARGLAPAVLAGGVGDHCRSPRPLRRLCALLPACCCAAGTPR